MKKLLLCLFAIVCIKLVGQPKDATVQLTTTVQKNPKKVSFAWATISGATAIKVYRKTKVGTTWTQIGNLSGTATSFADTSISIGIDYEYRISKTGGKTAETYVYAGIEVPAIEYRGKMLLLVDSTFKNSLNPEIKLVQQDLIGDGWQVATYYVSRTTPVTKVRRIITTEYTLDPVNVKGIYILGHVPVPYSGNFAPDGHPDHVGAWPADVYYADMDSSGWKDTFVNNPTATRTENRNIPGDGKFDTGFLPTPNNNVELEIGRVDLYNMPQFALNEQQLLKQYIIKNNKFKHKQTVAARRGLIDDNFGSAYNEEFASNGWRNFSSLFGASNTLANDYFTTMSSQSYLFSYGCGAGSYKTCAGVGTTGTFDSTSVQTVFTMLFGSYFGDWDSQNNFLRAPLASTGLTLTSCWAARPYWYFHHMGLGEHIGFSTKVSQNNYNLYINNTGSAGNRRGTHMALMGDPSLRLHPVAPASQLKTSINGTTVDLQWTATTDTVLGYYVYRLDTITNLYNRISGTTYLTGTTFTDNNPTYNNYYMVRAIKLETGSGSYFNLSQGIFDTIKVIALGVENIHTANFSAIVFPQPANTTTELSLLIESDKDELFEITIFDLLGKNVFYKKLPVGFGKNNIPLQVNLLTGTYICKITNTLGAAISKKIIIID
ncbi:MAG: T9SS type A sorting domain-containing protein [Bacteroidetes bacterium]|nr:T9SS type A sorting domain-containing protein [Bacteroidota bacterium]